jgi:hypothetical protein
MIGDGVAQVRGNNDFGIMDSPSIRREIVPPFKKHPLARASKTVGEEVLLDRSQIKKRLPAFRTKCIGHRSPKPESALSSANVSIL